MNNELRPAGWASNQRPKYFRLGQGDLAFKKEYKWLLADSLPFQTTLNHAQRLGATRVHVEPYIDADYRNEYANFYIFTFEPPSDWCERLHFWTDDELYLGYCTLRPIPGRPLSRTMLIPGRTFGDNVACVTRSHPRPFGRSDLSVRGFPFLSQDFQYGRCAHAVIWMITYYHHLENRCPRVYMSDIVDAAASHEEERLMPSAGLTPQQVGVTFRRLGLPIVRYDVEKPPAGETFPSLVTRYMNSGMPLALGTSRHDSAGHMFAIVGCGYDSDKRFFIIRADDRVGPYVRDYCDEHPEWSSLMIPLPERIYFSGEVAQRYATYEFARLLMVPELSGIADSLSKRRLRIRTYVTHSRSYKESLAKRDIPGGAEDPTGGRIFQQYVEARMPRWLWVAELQDAEIAASERHRTVLGELVIDATSDTVNPRVLNGNLGEVPLEYPWDGETLQSKEFSEDIAPYKTGTLLGW